MSARTRPYKIACLLPPLFNTLHVVALPPPGNNLPFRLRYPSVHPVLSTSDNNLPPHPFLSLIPYFILTSFLFIGLQSKMMSLNRKIMLLNRKIMPLNPNIMLLNPNILLLNFNILLLNPIMMLLNRKILLLNSNISLLNRKMMLLNSSISLPNSNILLAVSCPDAVKHQYNPLINTYLSKFLTFKNI